MYNFKETEEKARKVWQKNKKEIEKAIQDNPKKPLFSFLEGPPTANAPPGLHHLEVRTFKDIICKFKYMQGFSVPRKGGWDCHGLPVEVQIEKKLNLADKNEIVKYGIDKFINQCRDSVFSNIKDWNKSTEELAYWIDLKNPYITLNTEYIESVWWSLKELFKKDLLYEGHKVVPFCPRCGTPLSSHEVAQGYKDITEESVYIAFKLKKKGEYILAWTTTPWTLPGNVALAVGPKIDYVKIELPDKDKIILGKEKLNLIKGEYKILEELKGKDLEGLEYEPLYDIKETQNKNSHKVILADFVTTEEGTGVVHTAVMYGEDDYNIGIKAGLPAVHTVGEDGKFLPIVKQWAGRFVKSAEKDIKEDLKQRHLLFKVEKITHAYPYCWRCDTPLLYYAINSWFINVSKMKDELIKANEKINWYPEHIKDGRFGKWLEGAKDWALSRFKFWGTPLPIWRCKSCKHTEAIGSIEELKEKSTKKITGKIDLHKPWIDTIKLKCKCGKEMSRIPDVIDCWYDSGSATFAQFHYPFENKKEFEKRFPYDFISEAIDQTRGWFYTLHVISVLLFNKPAYKNVICAGHVVDEKGEKMSKSKGNILNPKDMIEKAGVDAIRLQFCTTDAGNPKRFSFDLMKDSIIPFLTVLSNCITYYKQAEKKKTKRQIEDKWIISRLNSTIKQVTEGLEKYNLDNPFQKISDFIVNDFSRTYIKMTRDREDTKEILGEILEKTALILAPFAPYISEEIYQNFSSNSVHLSKWPKVDLAKINIELEAELSTVAKIIESGLRERDKAQIGLKWPLSLAIIYLKGKENFNKYEEIIKSQLNVKQIRFESPASKETEFFLELETKMTPELESEGFAREISRFIQASRKKAGLVKENVIKLVILSKDLEEILKKQEKLIKQRVNAKTIAFSISQKEYDYSEKGKIKEKAFEIMFNKM